ncbi:hypothetical protein Tco_1214212 [Tanacetum coccineum]
MIIAGADNRPPMLEKSLYDSWKSRMEHYMKNRENRRMILNLVQNGPLIWLTVTNEDGLAPDVYAIVNHHKVAKEIWDRVKLLMQGTKLSLQEKECKLYDEFDKFTFVKGETLYHLPPEWSKFVTDVKLARDFHTTNYDQLYSYLEQHEVHANETRLMCERYQDPLAFVANYNQPPPQLTNYHSKYTPSHVPQHTNNMIPQVHSPQPYAPIYPPTHSSQLQINHSSFPPSHSYQSQMIHQTSSLPQIAYNSPQPSTQPLTEFPQMDSGLAVPVFNQGDEPIDCLNKAMAFLTAVASLRVTVKQFQRRQGQSYAGNSYKGNATSLGGNNTGGQARVTEDLDAYDSDCDDVSNAKAVLMANLSSYSYDVLSEVPHSETSHNDMAVQDTNLYAQQDSMILSVIVQMSKQMINHVNNWKKANQEKSNESVTAELERYKERVKTFEQCLNVYLSTCEKMIDSQMDDMIKEKLALKHQLDSLEQNLSNQIKEKESLL